MAFKNKTIINPKTGQTIKFLQTAKDTDGRLLEMEATFRPHSEEPPTHYHPLQEEKFSIITGQLTVRINGKLKMFLQGDQFTIPKNTDHSMWNASGLPTMVNWKVSPALNTESFFETTIAFAREGKTDKKGMPNILQVALIANKYNKIFRLSRPPFLMQKILFSILTPFAYLAGYRSTTPGNSV
jgi:quercetin dioxygenase-like cupin family protein